MFLKICYRVLASINAVLNFLLTSPSSLNRQYHLSTKVDELWLYFITLFQGGIIDKYIKYLFLKTPNKKKVEEVWYFKFYIQLFKKTKNFFNIIWNKFSIEKQKK